MMFHFLFLFFVNQLKLKEHLSVDILEKALFHNDDLVIPLPRAAPKSNRSRVVSPSCDDKTQSTGTSDTQLVPPTGANDQGCSEEGEHVSTAVEMKVPELLDVETVVSFADVISQVKSLISTHLPRTLSLHLHFGNISRCRTSKQLLLVLTLQASLLKPI